MMDSSPSQSRAKSFWAGLEEQSETSMGSLGSPNRSPLSSNRLSLQNNMFVQQDKGSPRSKALLSANNKENQSTQDPYNLQPPQGLRISLGSRESTGSATDIYKGRTSNRDSDATVLRHPIDWNVTEHSGLYPETQQYRQFSRASHRDSVGTQSSFIAGDDAELPAPVQPLMPRERSSSAVSKKASTEQEPVIKQEQEPIQYRPTTINEITRRPSRALPAIPGRIGKRAAAEPKIKIEEVENVYIKQEKSDNTDGLLVLPSMVERANRKALRQAESPRLEEPVNNTAGSELVAPQLCLPDEVPPSSLNDIAIHQDESEAGEEEFEDEAEAEEDEDEEDEEEHQIEDGKHEDQTMFATGTKIRARPSLTPWELKPLNQTNPEAEAEAEAEVDVESEAESVSESDDGAEVEDFKPVVPFTPIPMLDLGLPDVSLEGDFNEEVERVMNDEKV